jgi:hypothetical protein
MAEVIRSSETSVPTNPHTAPHTRRRHSSQSRREKLKSYNSRNYIQSPEKNLTTCEEQKKPQKQTPWPLVRKRTIPTEQQGDYIYMQLNKNKCINIFTHRGVYILQFILFE